MATLTLTVEISDAAADRVNLANVTDQGAGDVLSKQLVAAFMTQMDALAAANRVEAFNPVAHDIVRRAQLAIDQTELAVMYAVAAQSGVVEPTPPLVRAAPPINFNGPGAP